MRGGIQFRQTLPWNRSLIFVMLLAVLVAVGTVSFGHYVAQNAERSVEAELQSRQAELRWLDNHLKQKQARERAPEAQRRGNEF